MKTQTNLKATAQPFLGYLDRWYNQLAALPLAEVIGAEPERVVVVAIDVIDGFCVSGPLASARVGRIARPVAELFARAYELGVRAFALTQDTHAPDAPEFAAYPPHCIRGTAESLPVAELRALPFFDRIALFQKNSISSHFGTKLADWVRDRPQLQHFIVVGDCSDLCTYQAAMHLHLEANAAGLARRVIVPADAVETFDTPVAVAQDLGIRAHDGDLHHVLFLHHMAMNGVEVVRSLN